MWLRMLQLLHITVKEYSKNKLSVEGASYGTILVCWPYGHWRASAWNLALHDVLGCILSLCLTTALMLYLFFSPLFSWGNSRLRNKLTCPESHNWENGRDESRAQVGLQGQYLSPTLETTGGTGSVQIENS